MYGMQVLLAIAAGAMLVTPEWLTASMEAGDWLPEEPYLAQVGPPASQAASEASLTGQPQR